jgi:ABC-type sugar transport system ATPase subunit
MVFQSYALFPHLSVAENIVFGLKVRRVARERRDEKLKAGGRSAGTVCLLTENRLNFPVATAARCAGTRHHRGKNRLFDGRAIVQS